MKIIACEDWEVMSCLQKTLCLEESFPSHDRSSQRKRVHGVGANDAHYITQPKIDGRKVMCPAYRAWADMLRRAYSVNFQENHPAYLGVEVCEPWHSFSAFRKWWIEHQVDGWQLDKDLLGGARVYSPCTCIFVPHWLNSFATDRAAYRGDLPTGVCFHKAAEKFMATCRHPMTDKKTYLGLFNTKESAHKAWVERKLSIALELRREMDSIDERIYHGVTKIIKSMR